MKKVIKEDINKERKEMKNGRRQPNPNFLTQ